MLMALEPFPQKESVTFDRYLDDKIHVRHSLHQVLACGMLWAPIYYAGRSGACFLGLPNPPT